MLLSLMKILHLPHTYLPWTTGGKEVYCHSLCRALTDNGVVNHVAIHDQPGRAELQGDYSHEGIPVHVLPPLPGFLSRDSSYSKTYSELPGFVGLLDRIQPDLVHFHDQGGGASLSHLREVKRRNLPAVLTYHTPGQTCPQRELLRYGHIPCDGEVRLHRCTSCRLTVSGVPRPVAALAALAEWPGFDPTSPSKLARVLTGRAMTRMFRDSLYEFFSLADGIVVCAEWAREVLRLNGAAESKLHFFRTGGREPWTGPVSEKFPERQTLRIACLGRCTPIKGFHVLVDAIKRLPGNAPIEVHFLGPDWESESYGRDLLGRIRGDHRFRLPRLVPNAELGGVLAETDLVVVPSLWLETGPLTVFDAFASGIPVAGSRLGGIAELVKEGQNGWLFEPGNATELSGLLAGFLGNPDQLETIRQEVKPLRTMREVAADHLPIYRTLTCSTHGS